VIATGMKRGADLAGGNHIDQGCAADRVGSDLLGLEFFHKPFAFDFDHGANHLSRAFIECDADPAFQFWV
jgi:hypothetical protein